MSLKYNVTILLSLTFISLNFVVTFKPLSKSEQLEKFRKVNEEVEPFRKNMSECARQVRASSLDVENFIKRVPQSSLQGKCFVACMLKRNSIIVNNKISRDNLLEANRIVYEDDSEVMTRVTQAITECNAVIEDIFDICEYASTFNDCMHIKMEHVLDKVTMKRRMEALGQMSSNPDQWTEEEDEILKLLRDEL